MDPAYAPLYKPYHIDHEPVFNKGPVLFLYGSKDRIMTMVNKPGLRVSGGAPPHADPSQQGVFPQGVYGTEVPPYAKDITQGVLSRLFFTNKWALPGISRAGEPVREGADVTHFVMFAPNMEWTSPGFIQYERAQAPFTKVLHWVKKSNMDPGALVGYDIIAYGKSQIPISASDMDVTIRQEEGELVMSGLTHSLEASGVASVFDPRAVHSAPSGMSISLCSLPLSDKYTIDFAPASPKSD